MTMIRPGVTGERMAALFFLGLLLFNPPLLGIFDAGADATLIGIPLLYIYIFLAWGMLIALMAVAALRPARRGDASLPPPDDFTVEDTEEAP